MSLRVDVGCGCVASCITGLMCMGPEMPLWYVWTAQTTVQTSACWLVSCGGGGLVRRGLMVVGSHRACGCSAGGRLPPHPASLPSQTMVQSVSNTSTRTRRPIYHSMLCPVASAIDVVSGLDDNDAAALCIDPLSSRSSHVGCPSCSTRPAWCDPYPNE